MVWKALYKCMGEYPCPLFTWIWEVEFLSILALVECVCMYMSYNDQTRNIKQNLERGFNYNVDWSEKLRFEPLTIATVTNCDKPENFTVAMPCCVKWVQSHWKRILYIWYPCTLSTWIWEVAFHPIVALFEWCLRMCVYLDHNDWNEAPRKPSGKVRMTMLTCFT